MKLKFNFIGKIFAVVLLGFAFTLCKDDLKVEKPALNNLNDGVQMDLLQNPTPEELGIIPAATVKPIELPERTGLKSATVAAASSLEPATFEFTLGMGESINETVTASIAGAPPKGDVLFMLDLTGSMGGELNNAKVNSGNIMNAISAVIADAQFGVVSHMDYPAYISYCGYSTNYGTSAFGDYPYQLNQSITADASAVSSALNSLVLGAGSDIPESYARVLFETTADPAIGWRTGARKFVITWGDAIPHDCTLGTGVDPGRDGIAGTPDDLNLNDILNTMASQNITLIVLFSGGSSQLAQWSTWAAITGGSAFQINSDGTIPGGTDIASYITGKIEEATGEISALSVEVCTPGFEAWLTGVSPALPSPIVPPFSSDLTVTLTVPDGTPDGPYEFDICLMGDGAEYGRQHVVTTVKSCVIRYETAFGGQVFLNPSKGGWFYVYKPLTATPGFYATAKIYANQVEEAGTVQLIDDAGSLYMKITLENGWTLKEGAMEAVKVQGLTKAPEQRLRGYVYDYRGTELLVPVGTKVYPYYLVHLDLEICEKK